MHFHSEEGKVLSKLVDDGRKKGLWFKTMVLFLFYLPVATKLSFLRPYNNHLIIFLVFLNQIRYEFNFRPFRVLKHHLMSFHIVGNASGAEVRRLHSTYALYSYLNFPKFPTSKDPGILKQLHNFIHNLKTNILFWHFPDTLDIPRYKTATSLIKCYGSQEMLR